MKRIVVTSLSIGLLACLVSGQTGSAPATQPWGKADNGVRISAGGHGVVSVGGTLQMDIAVENAAGDALSMKDAFVWIIMAQGKEKAFLSGKVPLKGADVPASIDAGKTASFALNLGEADAVPYAADFVVKDGYPVLKDAKPAGRVVDMLPVGKVRVRAMVYVPERGVLVASNTVEVPVGEAEVSKLEGEARKKYVAELFGGFSRDEFAAKNAHDRAVKVGKDLTPDLIELLEGKAKQGKPPWFGRMWVTATLCDLTDTRATDALIAVLKSKDASSAVVAYSGWKVPDKRLHEAIDAEAGKSSLIAAWAARGSQEFAKKKRPELIGSVIDSLERADPKVKGTLAEALEKMTGQKFGSDAAKWKDWWEREGKAKK